MAYSPHARQVARTDTGDAVVFTERLLRLPRGFGAVYHTVTTSADLLTAPTIVRTASKDDALRAHADAVRALALDLDAV
jgi:hypothetical protein